MGRPLNIHWSSNASWAPSGYGVQTKLFLPRLQRLGHQMSATFWYGLEGGVINMDGVQIYPKGSHGYGQDVQSRNAKTSGAEIVITLIDAWVMDPDSYPPDLRWCPWFPVDMDPLPPPVANKVRRAFRPICYAKFGVDKCHEAGIDAAYVPHGVDTQTFQPRDRAECRRELGWKDDKFIVGMVAANKGYPSRKAFPECLEAFAEFSKKHSDAVLYVHSTLGENGQFGGVNLPEIVEALGISDRVLFPDQWGLHLGIDPIKVAKIYNAFDVLLSPSAGEGFGVPILEAQACGTPVITGDWTAMPEVTFCGWKVDKKDAKRTYTPMAAYQFWPHPPAIVECLEQAYKWRRPKAEVDAMVSRAREFDADVVTERYWKPVLEEIAVRMDRANVFQQHLLGAVNIPGVQIPQFPGVGDIGGAALPAKPGTPWPPHYEVTPSESGSVGAPKAVSAGEALSAPETEAAG